MLLMPIDQRSLKSSQVEIALDHVGTSFLIPEDTWRFGFLLDLGLSDGSHLFSMDNGER